MCCFILFIIAVVTVSAADTGCKHVEPSQPALCGVAGHFRSETLGVEPVLDQPQHVTSLEECASLCERRVYSKKHHQVLAYDFYYEPGSSWCQSFQFDTQTNFCQLSYQRVESAVKQNPKSPSIFFDHNCFDCGRFCSQPFGENLLDNGGFEGELFGPWETGLATFGPGYNSKHSYLCVGDGCYLIQDFNMCRGHLYVFQFDYKLTKVNGSAGFGFSLGDKYTRDYSIYSVSVSSPQDWTSVTGFYRTVALHQGISFGFDGKSAHHYIDNARVAHIPEPRIVQGAESIIINGGFETGDIAPWTTMSSDSIGHFKLVSPGINSSYALKFHSIEDYDSSPYLSQNITTKPNTTYAFSIDYKAKGLFWEVLAYFGPNGQGQVQTTPTMGSSSLSSYFFATSDSTAFTLEFSPRHNVERQDGTIIIDNIKLLEVEPSKYY